MSDNAKKNSLYAVTIHETVHYVRAESKRQAQQLAIDDRVSVRKADDDDIIRIVRSKARIINDVAEQDEATDEAQNGLFVGDGDDTITAGDPE